MSCLVCLNTRRQNVTTCVVAKGSLMQKYHQDCNHQFVGWLRNSLATCCYISGTGLLRQLSQWGRCCRWSCKQGQYMDKRPVSPSTDLITHNTWQGSHYSSSVQVFGVAGLMCAGGSLSSSSSVFPAISLGFTFFFSFLGGGGGGGWISVDVTVFLIQP